MTGVNAFIYENGYEKEKTIDEETIVVKMAINKINCALITTAKMKKVKFHNVFL